MQAVDMGHGRRNQARRATRCALLLVAWVSAGCATQTPQDAGARILNVPNGATVTLRQQFIICAATNAADALFLNGTRVPTTSGMMGVWVNLELGANQIVLTRWRNGQAELLDSKLLHYAPVGRYDVHDPFGDADGDKIPNAVDRAPRDARRGLDADHDGLTEGAPAMGQPAGESPIRITAPLDGQVFR